MATYRPHSCSPRRMTFWLYLDYLVCSAAFALSFHFAAVHQAWSFGHVIVFLPFPLAFFFRANQGFQAENLDVAFHVCIVLISFLIGFAVPCITMHSLESPVTFVHSSVIHFLLVFYIMTECAWLHKIFDRKDGLVDVMGHQDSTALYPDLHPGCLYLHYIWHWCKTHDWSNLFTAMCHGWRSVLADQVLLACHLVINWSLLAAVYAILHNVHIKQGYAKTTANGSGILTESNGHMTHVLQLFLLRPVRILGGFIVGWGMEITETLVVAVERWYVAWGEEGSLDGRERKDKSEGRKVLEKEEYHDFV